MLTELIDAQGTTALVRGRYGYVAFNRHDKYLGRAIAKYGECNELELRFLSQLCHAGATVFDIGTNIGNHAMFFARQVGPTGQVYCSNPKRHCFSFYAPI